MRRAEVAEPTIWQATALSTYTIEPDGRIDVVYADGVLTLAGPDTRTTLHRREGAVSFTGVSFGAGRFPALVGISAVELRDRRMPLEEVLPRTSVFRALHLLDAAAAREPDQVRTSIAPVLAGLLDQRGTASDTRLTDELARSAKQGISFAAVAARTMYSERHLHRISLRAFGYSYTTLTQIERFRGARRLITRGVPLAQAAYSSGYSDQAHMTREFSRWGGRTPSAVKGAANDVRIVQSLDQPPSYD